ncbi:MAG: hypothetical protein KGQ66_01280, partial [Acidobacteriota bacterium]|nr:hypothetical protein [Acidobacteriota bacterium]
MVKPVAQFTRKKPKCGAVWQTKACRTAPPDGSSGAARSARPPGDATSARPSRVPSQRRRERQRLDGERRGCLFCRQRDGGFNSREHILPESLGNTELILAQGVVCDRCNHQTLSTLDPVICDFTPISTRRTMLGVPSNVSMPTRCVRVPFQRRDNGFLARRLRGGPDLTVPLQSTRRSHKRDRTPTDGRVLLQWKFSGGRRLTARYASQLSRALLKAALECAWVDQGDMMLESRVVLALDDAPEGMDPIRDSRLCGVLPSPGARRAREHDGGEGGDTLASGS